MTLKHPCDLRDEGIGLGAVVRLSRRGGGCRCRPSLPCSISARQPPPDAAADGSCCPPALPWPSEGALRVTGAGGSPCYCPASACRAATPAARSATRRVHRRFE